MRTNAVHAALVTISTWVVAGAALAAPGDKLDRSRLGAPALHDDFSHGLSIDYGCDSKQARYVDQYCGAGPVDGAYPRTHGEHQCYSDSQFNGVNPFTIDGQGALTITAQAYPGRHPDACAQSKYTSGLISTQNSFRMKRGYWEVRAQMPPGGEARWPAIWLLGAHWPPEIDIVEMAKGVLHGTQHSRNRPGGAGSTAPELGCLCHEPHTFGLLNTGDQLIWYVDGVEWYRAAPDPGVADGNYYLIVNLQITGSPGGWTGNETPTSTPAAFKIFSIAAYPHAQ